jgi:hypothetical protein
LQKKIEGLIKLNNDGSSSSDASLAREWLEDVFAAHASSEKWTSKQIQSPRYQIMDSTLLLQFKQVVQGSIQPCLPWHRKLFIIKSILSSPLLMGCGSRMTNFLRFRPPRQASTRKQLQRFARFKKNWIG